MKAVLFIALITSSLFAIELSVKGSVEGIFDNREYPTLDGASQTFYGIRPTLSMGIAIDEMSSLHFGINHFFQFGQESGKRGQLLSTAQTTLHSHSRLQAN